MSTQKYSLRSNFAKYVLPLIAAAYTAFAPGCLSNGVAKSSQPTNSVQNVVSNVIAPTSSVSSNHLNAEVYGGVSSIGSASAGAIISGKNYFIGPEMISGDTEGYSLVFGRNSTGKGLDVQVAYEKSGEFNAIIVSSRKRFNEEKGLKSISTSLYSGDVAGFSFEAEGHLAKSKKFDLDAMIGGFYLGFDGKNYMGASAGVHADYSLTDHLSLKGSLEGMFDNSCLMKNNLVWSAGLNYAFGAGNAISHMDIGPIRYSHLGDMNLEKIRAENDAEETYNQSTTTPTTTGNGSNGGNGGNGSNGSTTTTQPYHPGTTTTTTIPGTTTTTIPPTTTTTIPPITTTTTIPPTTTTTIPSGPQGGDGDGNPIGRKLRWY